MPAGKKPTLLAQCKPRTLGGSTRAWRVRLYAPEAGGTKYQVMFRAPAGEGEPWKRVLRRASSEAKARKIFAQAEAALDTEKEAPARADVRASRTIGMLGEEYLKDSVERGKQPRTMEQRESRLNAHIPPTIGDVSVARWRVEHSRQVMEKGSKTIFSHRGREDLRGQFAAMRKLAWRLGWLDRSVDPLDGLEIGRADALHGATAQYVDPRLRPESRQVNAMADAADKLCGPDGTDPLMTRLPLLGTKIRVAGFGGLRLGEQNALRAIDVFFDRGYVHVNGSWITPRGKAGFRGPVKNHTLHEVPLPRSLLRDELLPASRSCSDCPRALPSSRSSTRRRSSGNAGLSWQLASRTRTWRGGTTPCRPRMSCGSSSTPQRACRPSRSFTTNAGTASAPGSKRTTPTTPGPAPSSTATCATTPPPSGSTRSWANPGRSSPSTSATSSPPS